jgi:hypothetical protein
VSDRIHYDTELEIDAAAGRYQGRLQIQLCLPEPRACVVLRLPAGTVGRAEARFGGQRWAAAHSWTEETDDGRVALFEFREPLPAGEVCLVVPLEGELTPQIAALLDLADPAHAQAVLPHLASAGGAWSVRGREATLAPIAL